MKKLCVVWWVVSGAGACRRQRGAGQIEKYDGSTEVLTVTREFVKPGKTGEVHDKAESAFVKAMMAAKSAVALPGVEFDERQATLLVSERVRHV